MPCRWFSLAFALTLIGCPAPKSESEKLTLQRHGIYSPPVPSALAWTGEQPVLVGTRLCADLYCNQDCPSVYDDAGTLLLLPDVSACFSTAVDGPAEQDDAGCLTFAQEGAVAWRHAAADCELASEDGGWVPESDSFVLLSTTRTGVEARFDLVLERMGALYLDEEEPDYLPLGEFPSDFSPEPDKPLKLLAGERTRLPVGLFSASTGSPVGYRVFDAVFSVNEIQAATDGGPAAVIELAPGALGQFPVVTMAAGGIVEVALDLGTERFEVGRVEGVTSADLDSVEVLAFRPEPADQSSVVGFRALYRDADGNSIFGVPASWELVTGRYVVRTLAAVSGRVPQDVEVDDEAIVLNDWVYLEDLCRPPDTLIGPRRASLIARFAGLEGEADVTWQQVGPERANDPNFEEDDRCAGTEPEIVTDGGVDPDPEPSPLPGDEGCSCRTQGQDTSAPLWLGVLLVGGLFRRRPRRA